MLWKVNVMDYPKDERGCEFKFNSPCNFEIFHCCTKVISVQILCSKQGSRVISPAALEI